MCSGDEDNNQLMPKRADGQELNKSNFKEGVLNDPDILVKCGST